MKLTVNGASPDLGEALADAKSVDVGDVVVILVESVSLLAALSVTVRVAV